jgi:hypothetical protein
MSQLMTLFWLRYVIFRNSLTGRREIVSTLLRIVIMGGYLMASLGVGLALFLIMVLNPDSLGGFLANSMGTLFGALVFLTLVTQATGTSASFDPRRFILFPVSFTKLYALNLASAFSEPVLITLLPAIAGILLGRGVALGQPFGGMLAFVSAAVWVDSLFVFTALLTAWLLSGRKRRTEIFFTALMGLFLVSGQLLPRIIDTNFGNGLLALLQPYRALIGSVLVWTPFGVWREFYDLLDSGSLLAAAAHLLPVIVIWTGLIQLAGYAVFTRLAISARTGTSGTARHVNAAAPAHRLTLKLPFVSEQLSVIFARELTYLLRNTVTWLNTANILVITLVAFSPARPGFRQRGDRLIESTVKGWTSWREFWWVTLITGYTFMVNHQQFSAIFAFDGSGFRQYLLTPVRWRRVLMGKNLAACVVAGTQICLILVGTQIIYGDLTWRRLFVVGCAALTAMSVSALVGNLLSIHFPYPAEFGIRRRRAQENYGAIILVIWIALFILVSGLFTLPLVMAWLFMSATAKYVMYAVLALAACALYLFRLEAQSRLLEVKRFDLAEALTRRAEKV